MTTSVIALTSSKGGTGKTTTALNLAVALAERGRDTLLVDLDPQGAVGLSLGRSDTEWAGLAEHLLGRVGFDEVLFRTKLPTLSLLPRGRLDPLDIPEYELALHQPELLGQVIETARGRFQYVLLDTPSGLGLVPRAALAVADWALVPMQAEPLALRSLGQVLHVLDGVRAGANPRLQLLGILPTMVQLARDDSFQVMSTVWSGFAGVLETYIPRAEIFTRASQEGLPVAFLGGRPPAEATRFDLLAAELEDLIRRRRGDEGVTDERPRRELV